MNVQPDYPNPFRKARSILRMTQEEVARSVGHTKLYVLRTEQGIYERPSRRLMQFFSEHIEDATEFSFEYFATEYREYQRRCRLANGPKNLLPVLVEDIDIYADGQQNRTAESFRNLLRHTQRLKSPEVRAVLSEDNEPIHPFRWWMQRSHMHLTAMQVAKAFCINPSLLQRYLQQGHMVLEMPGPIREALLEAGYQLETVASLDLAYSVYREVRFKDLWEGGVGNVQDAKVEDVSTEV